MNKKGFTLLEILIALFIFTIMSMILATSLHSILNSQAATESKALRLQQLQIALLIMGRDLQQAIDRPILNTNGNLEFALLGTEKNLKFTHTGFANPFGSLRQSSLQRVEYHVNEQQQFIRKTWPVLDRTATSKPAERVLLANVTAIQYAYLDERGEMQNHWPLAEQALQTLPRAVHITLHLANSGDITQLFLVPGAKNAY